MSNILTDDQRIDRVGEILALGIGRFLVSESECSEVSSVNQSTAQSSCYPVNLPRGIDDILRFISKSILQAGIQKPFGKVNLKHAIHG